MRIIKRVEITPIFVKCIPETLEDNNIYISEEYKISIHKCLCGCGEISAMPIDEDGWKLIKNNDGTISFTPSIGNFQFPCKSHYIITNNIANFV